MDPKTKDGPEQKHKIYKIKPEKLEERSTMLGFAAIFCGHQRLRQQKNRKKVLLILFFKFYQNSEEAENRMGGTTTYDILDVTTYVTCFNGQNIKSTFEIRHWTTYFKMENRLAYTCFQTESINSSY